MSAMFRAFFRALLFSFLVLVVALPNTGTASAKKCRRSEKIAEVVPASRVWKCVYSNVVKNASDQAKKNRKSMEYTRPKSRRVIGRQMWLRGASSKHRCNDENDGEAQIRSTIQGWGIYEHV
jgi:hypothetical protein